MPTRGVHGVIISAGIYTYFLTNVTQSKLSFLAGRASGIELAGEVFSESKPVLVAYLSTAIPGNAITVIQSKLR